MKSLIISTSLNPGSHSRLMARHLHEIWRAEGRDVERIDLQDFDLPICDGGAAFENSQAIEIGARVEAADAVVFAVPIYNFDANAATKNLVELVGGKLEGKLAGFLCAAGGQFSYMAPMAIANSLMLDFRTVILPRFVYAARDAFEGEEISLEIRERIALFGKEFQALGEAVVQASGQV